MHQLCKILEQIAFSTRPKFQARLFVAMDKPTQEEHLSQPLQTNNKHFEIAVTFLTGYSGIFNVTNSKNKFYFLKSIHDDFTQIIIPPGVYGTEGLNNEIKRIIIKESHFTEENYPFIIKPNFSTLGGVIEANPNFIGIQISFVHNNWIRVFLGFDSVEIHAKDNLSQNLVVFLSFI